MISRLCLALVLSVAMCIGTTALGSVCQAQDPVVIVGQVIDGTTGQPIAGSVVTVRAPGFASRSAIVDAAGRFVVKDVPAARASIVATRTGYLGGRFDQRTPFDDGRLFQPEDEAQLQRIVLRLWKSSTVSGSVADDRGEPVVGARVMALRRDLAFDPPRWSIPSNVTIQLTDDRGQFRLTGVPPGSYLVATPSDYTRFGRGREAGDVNIALPMYHPGVASASLAIEVLVTPGRELAGVNIRLPASPENVRPLAGKITCARTNCSDDGSGWDVELVPAEASALTDLDIWRGQISSDGKFLFAALAPGRYLLRAARFPRGGDLAMLTGAAGSIAAQINRPPDPDRPVEPPGDTLWVELPVSVNADTPDELSLEANVGFRIRGRLVFEGKSTAPPESELLSAAMLTVSENGRVFSRGFSARVGRDGRFATAGLPPGRYGLLFETMFPGWTVSRLAVNGLVVADHRITIRDSDVVAVDVTFTDRPSEVRGLVSDPSGRAVPEAPVVAIPTNKDLWKDFRATPPRLARVRANGKGAYVIRGLPPGDYWIVALSTEPTREWYDRDTLQVLASRGEMVRLADGVTIDRDLKATQTVR